MFKELLPHTNTEKSENEIEKNTSDKKLFNRQLDFSSKFFEEKYGGRKPEENISRYVTNLLKKLLKPEDGDIKVVICSRVGDINAFAFQNGKIFVSEELIDFCKSEDELLFVLGHELNHIRNKHSEKQHDLRVANETEGFLKSYQDEISLSRVHEYHADVKSFVDLNNQGINPYGAISFTQRMKNRNRYKKAGMTHGEDADRLVNLFWGTKLIDLDNLRPELGDLIPQEFHKDESHALWTDTEDHSSIILKEGFLDDEKRYKKSLKIMKNMGLLESRTVAKSIYERRNEILTRLEDKNISTGTKNGLLFREEKNRELFLIFLRKVEDAVHKVDGVSVLAKDFAVGALLDLFYKIPVGINFARNTNNDEHFDIPETAFGEISTLADIEKCLRDTFDIAEANFLYCSVVPSSFLLGIAEILRRSDENIDNESFDFSKFKHSSESVLNILRKQYEEKGLIPFNEEDVDECRALMWLHVVLELTDDEAEKVTREIFSKHYKLAGQINSKRKLLGMKSLGMSDFEIFENKNEEYLYDEDTRDINKKKEMINQNSSFKEMFTYACRNMDSNEIDFVKRNKSRLSVLSVMSNFIEFSSEDTIKQITIEEVSHVILVMEDILRDLSKETLPLHVEEKIWNELNLMTDKILYVRKEILNLFLKEGLVDVFGLFKRISLNRQIFCYYISDLSERELLPLIKNEDDFHFVNSFLLSSFTENSDKDYENSRTDNGEIYKMYLSYGVFSVLNSQIQSGEISSTEEAFKKFTLLSQKTEAKYTFPSMVPSDVPSFTNKEDENSIESGWQLFVAEKNAFFDYILNNKSFSLEKSEDLRSLLLLTEYIENPFIVSAAKKGIFSRVLDDLSFAEGYNVIFQSKTSIPLEVMELFLQKKAHSHSEIKQCHDEIFARYLNDSEGNKSVSGLIFSEVLFQNMTSNEKLSLLRELLETQNGDIHLRERILSASMDAYEDSDDVSVELQLRTPESIRKDMYRINDEEKYFLLQKLFLGRNGIFENDRTKFDFVDYFFDEQVEGNKEIVDTLRIILKKIIEKCSPEQAFFAIQGLLRGRILLPSNNDKNLWNQAKENLTPKDKYSKEYREERRTKNLDVIFERMDKEEKRTSSKKNLEDSMVALFSDEMQGDKTIKGKLSESGLVVEIAKNLGSMGTRFLQLAGQYMELTSELQEKFNQSYDAVSGQSKLTAYNTLKKNWKNFEQEVLVFGEEVGGGSMTSVYHIETISQQKRVVKVLNPSFRYQLEEVYKILNEVFSDLSSENPEKYGIASHMISDLMKWIEEDFNYENFLAEDKKFLKKWNGYKQKKNEYEITIPQSFGPESKRFKQEEEVEGKNLTKLNELKAEGHNLSQVVSLVIGNFVAQLKDGQVHADIHIGNFRVTSDKKVAILDRNYFLQFDFKDRLFLWELSKKAGDQKGLAKTLIGYFSGLDENKGFVFDEIETELQESLSGVNGSNFMEILPKVLITLRKNNIHIPLKITLLVKNINALKRMADMVGLDQEIEF